MDAREAYNWRKAAETRALQAKYAAYSIPALYTEIDLLRFKAKAATKSSRRKEYEAQMEEIWQEIFRRNRENGDTE